jgi:hypothetical protein
MLMLTWACAKGAAAAKANPATATNANEVMLRIKLIPLTGLMLLN